MQSKISFKWSLFIVGILGILLFSIAAFFKNTNLPAQDVVATSALPSNSQPPQSLTKSIPATSIQSAAASEQKNSLLAARLKIPKINVDAAVESVGLTPDGAMDAPKGPNNVAWFNIGPLPGEKGSAVIDGHFGWYNNAPAVFDNLYILQKGDKLYVEDKKGVTTTFIVQMSRSYDPAADASEVFSSNDGKAHLNLITCEGVWDKATKSYSNRLVVFADKEME